MRARFTTSIASADYSYPAGREVAVTGTQYGVDTVPESVGRSWLASGVLERIAVPLESAAVRPNETATRADAQPRRAHQSHQRS